MTFNFGVVDLAKGPRMLGSLARSTTSTPVRYLDRALVPDRREFSWRSSSGEGACPGVETYFRQFL